MEDKKKDRLINYNFFHWGPLLFQTNLTEEELNEIKKLCSKKGKDYRQNLAGLLDQEVPSYPSVLVLFGLPPKTKPAVLVPLAAP